MHGVGSGVGSGAMEGSGVNGGTVGIGGGVCSGVDCTGCDRGCTGTGLSWTGSGTLEVGMAVSNGVGATVALLEPSVCLGEGESTTLGAIGPCSPCESLTEPSTMVDSIRTSTLMAMARHSFTVSV